MTERFPFGPASTARNPPPSPLINSHPFGSARSGPGRWKQGRRSPLRRDHGTAYFNNKPCSRRWRRPPTNDPLRSPTPLTSRPAPGPERTIPAAEAAGILHPTCPASPAVRTPLALVIMTDKYVTMVSINSSVARIIRDMLHINSCQGEAPGPLARRARWSFFRTIRFMILRAPSKVATNDSRHRISAADGSPGCVPGNLRRPAGHRHDRDQRVRELGTHGRC